FCLATSSTVIYTLSLHDALPIYRKIPEIIENVLSILMYCRLAETGSFFSMVNNKPTIQAAPSNSNTIDTVVDVGNPRVLKTSSRDRKSTRLNSSHVKISYAVFCL